MILAIGGFAAGKRAWALELGYTDADIVDVAAGGDALGGLPVIVNAQNLVRDERTNPADVAEKLAQRAQLVLFTEVGSGIVPISASDRAWRDRAGALARELAARSEAVVQLVCGIPRVLKGVEAEGQAVELVLLRHGTTAESERRAYTGWTNVPLTARGRAEAQTAGVHPDVDLVFTSTLDRARETARICFPNARIAAMANAREMNFGDFQGRTADEMEHDADYRAWVDGFCELPCPNGESQAAFIARIGCAIRGIVVQAALCGRKRVVVAAHGGTIMAAMHAFTQTERSYYDWGVGPCEGYRACARIQNGQLTLSGEQRFSSLAFLAEEPRLVGLRPASSSFFTNRACAYFPCHTGIDEDEFNCLFCYCPLYALGPKCGGNFTYTKNGRKNCTECTIPHQGEAGAKLVAARYEDLAALARQ